MEILSPASFSPPFPAAPDVAYPDPAMPPPAQTSRDIIPMPPMSGSGSWSGRGHRANSAGATPPPNGADRRGGHPVTLTLARSPTANDDEGPAHQ